MRGCFLFFFRSFYRFFYDRIRKAAALQGGHHKVAAAIGRRDLVVAALQRRGFAYPVIKEAIRRVEEGE